MPGKAGFSTFDSGALVVVIWGGWLLGADGDDKHRTCMLLSLDCGAACTAAKIKCAFVSMLYVPLMPHQSGRRLQIQISSKNKLSECNGLRTSSLQFVINELFHISTESFLYTACSLFLSSRLQLVGRKVKDDKMSHTLCKKLEEHLMFLIFCQ